ncbi:MAG: SulP family inorganic anion transporter [Chloroflexi bacterium]|nr:SulP family inorganic anion transporter [Chloroflexota bacterium]
MFNSTHLRYLPKIKMLAALHGLRIAGLPTQISAGITLAALMIPLNIGYAQVAGLPPIVGLYACLAPMIFLGLFSASRNFVAGADAAVIALMGSLLITLAPVQDPRYVELAYALALLTAAVLFALWLFRLGRLANFLSKAVLLGLVSGLGIEVLTSQVQKIMAIHVEANGWLAEVWEMVRSLPMANLYCVALGVGAIVLIRLLSRYVPKIPGALVALVLGTAAVAVFHLEERGVSMLGQIPAGLPTLHVPQVGWMDYINLFPGALAIAGITMAEGLLLVRKYAAKYGDETDADQELFALGMANLATGLTGGLLVGASASRTAAMDSAGMRSQVPGIVGAIVVAIVLLFLTDLLAIMPIAVLAGIVANAALGLIEVHGLQEIRRLRRSEFQVAVVCLACVLALGPLQAVIIAFLLSTIEVVRRAANPQMSAMHALPGGSAYVPCSDLSDAMPVPGLILFRFGAQLFFANANAFQEGVKQIVEGHTPVRWFVLDAEAVSDIDTTGAEALAHAIEDLEKRGISFALVRAVAPVPELLERYGLLDKIGQDRLYATNRLAVEAYCRETGQANAALASDKGELAAQIQGETVQ